MCTVQNDFEPVRVLLTCVGGYFSFDTCEALKQSEQMEVTLIGVDATAEAHGKHAVDAFYQVPHAGKQPDAFTDRILEICARESVDVLIPGSDEETAAISSKKPLFDEQDVCCTVWAHEKVELVRNKVRLFDHLSENGISVPRYQMVDTGHDLETFLANSAYPEHRVILKPATGRGARHLYIVDSDCTTPTREPEARDQVIGNRKVIEQKLDELETPYNLVGMEFLPGPVYDVDCLVSDGESLCILPRRRLHEGPFSRGIEGHQIVQNHEIREKAERICRELSLNYAFDMDFGTRDDGSHGLLEVNPRISGSVASGMSAGVNVLSLLLHLVKGMDLPDVQPAYGANAIPVHRMCFFRNSSNAG